LVGYYGCAKRRSLYDGKHCKASLILSCLDNGNSITEMQESDKEHICGSGYNKKVCTTVLLRRCAMIIKRDISRLWVLLEIWLRLIENHYLGIIVHEN